MQLNITITSPDETGEAFVAALHEDSPFINEPPAHEAWGDTPQQALAALVAAIDINDAVAAELGDDNGA